MQPLGIMLLLILCMTGLFARGKQPAEPAKVAREEYIRSAKTRPAEPGFNPASLWVEQASDARALTDFKARNVDDIVIIQISEVTNALSTGDTSTSKKSNNKSTFGKLFGLERGIRELPTPLNTESENNFKGSGSAKRSQSLTTTVAARVTDVLPNGNLVIQAVKEIRVDNENQTVVINGVVRPRDITPQNIVSSRAIADVQIRLIGKGQVTDQLRPGFLQRLLLKIFPF